MKTRARSASVFIHNCFRVFGYPGETRARVVYMASQMNRDVQGVSKKRRPLEIKHIVKI